MAIAAGSVQGSLHAVDTGRHGPDLTGLRFLAAVSGLFKMVRVLDTWRGRSPVPAGGVSALVHP